METSNALRSPKLFGVKMIAALFAVKIACALLLAIFDMEPGDQFTEEDYKDGTLLGFIILFPFMMPVETLIGQMAPIELLRKTRLDNDICFISISALIFGWLHVGWGPGFFIFGFAAGCVLSFCYLSWRPKSLKYAFWGTTLVHIAHNYISFTFVFLAYELA